MITNRTLRLAAALAAATVAFSAADISAAWAAGTDPTPPPAQPGPRVVDPKYADLNKLQDVVLGSMAIEPVTGDLETYMKVTTAGGCPRGSNTVTRIFGPKLPKAGQNVIGNNWVYDFGSPPADRMTSPLTITLEEVLERQPIPIVLDGTYQLRMQCQLPDPDDFAQNFGVFQSRLNIRDGKYTALTTVANLPKTPSPLAGPEAYAALEVKRQAPAPPPPMIDPIARSIEEQKAAATTPGSDSGPNEATVAGVTGGLLALGLLPLAWTWRRRSATAGGR